LEEFYAGFMRKQTKDTDNPNLIKDLLFFQTSAALRLKVW